MIFEIAYQLGIPVYKIIDEMPHQELKQWMTFFKRRPVGWREDQRTAMLMKVWGFKGQPESIFPALKQLKENIPAEIKELPKGKFLDMMLTAKNGDDSNWSPPWIGKK